MFHKITQTLLTTACVSLTHAAATGAAGKPNIVVILSDDMGYGDLGVQGCSDIPTPNIDRICNEGVRFTDAYANAPLCTPSRAALLSGRYQQRMGMESLVNDTGPLPISVKTLPDRLRAAGYRTDMVGKWHLGDASGYTPLDRGFDHFFGFYSGGHFYRPGTTPPALYRLPIIRDKDPIDEQRYLTDAFGDEAAAYIKQAGKSEDPFFLYLAFNAPHTPLEGPDRYADRFKDLPDKKRRVYARMMLAMDDAVGKVLQALEKTGQAKHTLVIFTNDNGGPITRGSPNGSRNTPLRGGKGETFEGGIRVPLFMRWPGVIPPGTTCSQPVMTFDVTATALAAGNADQSNIDGANLLPCTKGESHDPPHKTLFWRWRFKADNNYAVRQGDWKFVHSNQGNPRTGMAPASDMLFNVRDDISETTDLAAKHPEKLAELKKLYATWSEKVDADCRQIGKKPSLFDPAAARKRK